MKLYDGGRAPNPRRVRVFLAEKGISVPTEQVDLGALAHKSAAFTAINPLQRVPALVLDDGTVITESIAICRYFELLHPKPPLFGIEPKEVAIDRNVAAADGAASAASGRACVPQLASRHEGDGGAAGAGLGGGQQAARAWNFSMCSTGS